MEIKEEYWELINDDGFVYRRKKRQHPDSSAAPAQLPDSATKAIAHEERKKKTLLKLKTKYQQEIHHWELLSNTLKASEDRTQNQPPPTVLPLPDQSVPVLQKSSSDSTCNELTDTLFAQVEAQEATICEISRLCDAAEVLCDAEEQWLKQPFIDLPIWESSPRKLIQSLLKE